MVDYLSGHIETFVYILWEKKERKKCKFVFLSLHFKRVKCVQLLWWRVVQLHHYSITSLVDQFESVCICAWVCVGSLWLSVSMCWSYDRLTTCLAPPTPTVG